MFSLLKSNAVYVAAIFTGAFAVQTLLDTGVNKWYENHNKGKLWKDLKPLVLNGFESDEE